MPHIVLEYSDNLTGVVAVPQLLDELHRALGAAETFETDRIKTRAIEHQTYLVGEQDRRGFLHASVAFSPGRAESGRSELGRKLLQVLDGAAESAAIEIARSVEIRQFEPGMYFNHLDERADAAGE